MTTPIGSLTPYCTPAQALLYIDARQWGDLVNDDGTRASTAALATNLVMVELLLEASGEVELACNKGERYLPSDLALLALASTASAATLRKLTAWVAYGSGWARRRPTEALPQKVVWAYSVLNDLSQGAKLFSIQEVLDADVPTDDFENQGDWDKRGDISDVSRRYFGVRGKYYRPLSGGGGGYYGGDC